MTIAISQVEYWDGDEVVMTFEFTDDTQTPPVDTNPTSALGIIKVGYTGTVDVDLTLNDLTPVTDKPGWYTYRFDTTGITTETGRKVECQVQMQATDGLKCTSLPAPFTVFPKIF